MDATFTNSKNSKTSHPHKLLLNLTNKIDLRRDENLLHYQISVFTTHGKIRRVQIKTINLKHQLQCRIINLNYLIDHILYHIFNFQY